MRNVKNLNAANDHVQRVLWPAIKSACREGCLMTYDGKKLTVGEAAFLAIFFAFAWGSPVALLWWVLS
jgi:hypothetical protein